MSLEAELRAERDELIDALRKCLAVAKAWHDMDGASDVWDIYYDNAPEMKPIREVLAKHEKECA